jgi:hypothetical protein
LNMGADGDFTVNSQRLVALFFRQQPRTIERWRAAGMPGQRRQYDLQEILFWAIESGKLKGCEPDDPMLSDGTDSEGLERFRLARAQLEEIKLAEMCGRIVMQDDFHESSRIMLAPLRALQETLKRRQDQDTLQLVHDAIDEMERGLGQQAETLKRKEQQHV